MKSMIRHLFTLFHWIYNFIVFLFIVHYYYKLGFFLQQRLQMVFYWILSDSKYYQVSRTLLSILTDLNNVVIGTVSTRPLISKSSCSYIKLLSTVTSASITFGITVTFMFRSLFFFSFSRKVLVLISLFTFFQFYCVVTRNSKVHYSAGSLFFSVDYH